MAGGDHPRRPPPGDLLQGVGVGGRVDSKFDSILLFLENFKLSQVR
jgi:hypothetical protein